MKTLTIFTPTYNRAYILPKLYDSLCGQTCHDFEWLIVDDGSTDDTCNIVRHWTIENKIEIRYIRQENGGKMRATNKALELVNTKLFACVDSDDYLVETAVADVLDFWHDNYGGESDVAGMIANRLMVSAVHPIPREIVKFPDGIKRCRMRDLGQMYGHRGETTIVFRSEVAKQFPFPEIDGERFITEAVVYDRIDYAGFDLLLCHKPVVICEYLPDGYTRSRAAVFKNAPLGWSLYYNQQLDFWKAEVSATAHLRSLVYYIVMSRLAGRPFTEIYNHSSDKSMRFVIAAILAFYYKRKFMKLF